MVALFLEETGLPYEVVPVDTAKGQQHTDAFRAINPNGKVPAIIDTDGPGGVETRVFDSTAILLYLGEKTGKLMGSPSDRGELLSWLFFIATGFIVGNAYTIADISGWGWIDRASFVLPGSDDPLAAYPNIRRWFRAIDARPAVAKARAIGSAHSFKKEVDEETRRALFPSNYPPAAA